MNYSDLPFTKKLNKGGLPVLWTHRDDQGWYEMGYCIGFQEGLFGGMESLLSRLV